MVWAALALVGGSAVLGPPVWGAELPAWLTAPRPRTPGAVNDSAELSSGAQLHTLGPSAEIALSLTSLDVRSRTQRSNE